MSFTNIVTDKVNKYINSENIRKERLEYVKNNGTIVNNIRTPFGSRKLYLH